MTIKYTPDHEWLQINADGTATVGITSLGSPAELHEAGLLPTRIGIGQVAAVLYGPLGALGVPLTPASPEAALALLACALVPQLVGHLQSQGRGRRGRVREGRC